MKDVIDRVITNGPQHITRHGRVVATVVPAEEKKPRPERKGTLAEFFMNSPLRGSGIVIERERGLPQEIDL